ncbi:MAG: hypothetical protein V1914_04490 [archaeon]
MTDMKYYLVFSDPSKGLFDNDREIEGLLNYLHIDSRYLLISELADRDRVRFTMHRSERCSLLRTPEDFLIPDRKNTLAYIVQNKLRVAEAKDEVTLLKRYCPTNKPYDQIKEITKTGKPEAIAHELRFPTVEDLVKDINNSDELRNTLIKRKWFGDNRLRGFIVDLQLTVPLISGDNYIFTNIFSAKQWFPEIESKIRVPLKA